MCLGRDICFSRPSQINTFTNLISFVKPFTLMMNAFFVTLKCALEEYKQNYCVIVDLRNLKLDIFLYIKKKAQCDNKNNRLFSLISNHLSEFLYRRCTNVRNKLPGR